MNKIWIFLFVISIIALCFGDPTQVLSGLLTASNSAVKLSFSLCAIYAIWMGLFMILEKSGLSQKLSKFLSPIINKIFGKCNLSNESKQYVSMNISANLLGMGGAATPLGIKAIESMQKDNKDKSTITFPMIMLIAISCSSVQLLPTSIIGMLASAGSKEPTAIILPSILCSIISTAIAILLVYLFHFIFDRKKDKTNG
ncbi:MAG: spore maturation protein [Clostridiales bacterium]|nr:spore maturation protein [Clostridiales bacterium]